MGHGEGLVQVKVAYVGSDIAGVGKTDLCVHVGAVHVYLSSGVVYGVDDVAYAALEHAVRRGIGYHKAAQLRTVLLGLGFQVVDVDVAVDVAGDRDDLHAGHGRRGGVGAVRRCRDQDHVAVALAAALVPCADYHKAGVLACGARVGHQRAAREAGNGGQITLQRGYQLAVALGLVGRHERVHILEARQRQRLHQRCGVELHGARAERYHGVHERDVAHFETLDITHHLRLGAVRAEDALGEDLRAAHQRLGDRSLLRALDALGFAACRLGEYIGYGLQVIVGGKLVERDVYALVRGVVEVDAARQCYALYHSGLGLDLDRIEYGLGRYLVSHAPQRLGCGQGCRVCRHGGAAQTLGAVVDAVEARHRCHESLRGADVRCGLLALDMLFAHLQRHAQSPVAQTVDRHANDAAGHLALIAIARGHVAGARASEAHRASQTLRCADGYVGAPLGGRFQQCERQQVGHGRDGRSGGVRRLGECAVVAHLAVGCRVLHYGAELLAREGICRVVVADDLDAERLAARKQHVEGLGIYVTVDEELVATLLDGLTRAQGEHHQHGLGCCRSLVQKRAVGHLHAREREYGCLEVEKRLQASLRYLGLIGRVGCIPCRVLEDVARDDGRHCRRIVAHADERAQAAVLGGYGGYMLGVLPFGHRLWQTQRLFESDRLGDDLRDELLDGIDSDCREHRTKIVGIVQTGVTVDEPVKVFHRFIRVLL